MEASRIRHLSGSFRFLGVGWEIIRCEAEQAAALIKRESILEEFRHGNEI